jgi:hypothetical protein
MPLNPRPSPRVIVVCKKLLLVAIIIGAIGIFSNSRPISIAAAQESPSITKSGPQIAGCPVFPENNVWNVPIDKLPKDPHSDNWIATIGPAIHMHPNFGADPNNGIPINIIDSKVKHVKVTFEYRDDSDLGNYPIPPDALREGGGAAGADDDRHVIVVEKDRCMLLELYAAQLQSDGSWKAGSGIKMDLTDNALRDADKTSADAAGLPILPGLVRYDEVEAGEIRHALRFTVPKTQRAYVWPARHFASRVTDTKYPPMGVRVRLRSSFDISRYSKTNQVILTALKRYGMILADNGSPWYIIGAPDPRWNDMDLHELQNVYGKDFEAVDESDWQFLANSGRVDPVSLQ